MRLEKRCHFFDAEALRHVEKAAAARGQRGADGPLEPTHVTEESRRRAYEQSAVGCDGCGAWRVPTACGPAAACGLRGPRGVHKNLGRY